MIIWSEREMQRSSERHMFNILSVAHFLEKIAWKLHTQIKMDPFDYGHNPGLSWKVNLWGLLSKSQNYSKY